MSELSSRACQDCGGQSFDLHGRQNEEAPVVDDVLQIARLLFGVPAVSGTRDFSAGHWAVSNPATHRWCARFRSRPIRRNRESLAGSMTTLRKRSFARYR